MESLSYLWRGVLIKEKRFRRIKVETVCPLCKGLFDMDLNDLTSGLPVM
ncbi:MAG: hypothetical protein IH932_01030 [Thaumarchaeota archaeon]|nr:hypothetical protein [Nitrososphaerota archaeon]